MGMEMAPAMTVVTCAWMEKEWMRNVDHDSKKFFRIKRFMDDILCFYVENEKWDHERFVKDLCESEIYVKPLTLEDGKEGTFLETRFQIQGNEIEHWLKNDNENGTKVWRYITISTVMAL